MPDRPATPYEVRLSRRLLSLISAVACTVVFTACTENLESGSGCPVLCPQNEINLQDVVLEAVVVDSSIAGFPATGFEETLLLANRLDSLETAVIVRFDSLPGEYGSPQTTPITSVDSVTLTLGLYYPLRDQAAFTLKVFDVDTLLPAGSAADTTVATLAPLFRDDRLLASQTIVPSALADSVIRVTLPAAKLLEKITAGRRLRLGFRMDVVQPSSIRLLGVGDASTLSLRFRVSPDTTVPPIVLLPLSRTPTDAFTARALSDYQVVFRGTAPPPPQTLAVGGVPARRTYLQFDLPSNIVDSTRIVRATLILTQAPNPASAVRTDSITIFPDVIAADTNITNLERLMRFTSRTFAIGSSAIQSVPAIRLVPADSGDRNIEMAALLAAWSSFPRAGVPRALVLRAEDEGAVGGTILFHSREAPVGVRPRLRLTYAPRVDFGLP